MSNLSFTRQIEIMEASAFEYSPRHLLAMASAVLKTAQEEDDLEEGFGMQKFIQTLVHMVTDTDMLPDSDERIFSDVNVTAMKVLPIKARTYARAFRSIFAATVQTAEDNEIDAIDMVESSKQLKGFLTAAKGCFELTWEQFGNGEVSE